MAKSKRASSRKANNQRLKQKVFGPVEAARVERLSARLLEIAAQPKPADLEKKDEMELDGDQGSIEAELPKTEETGMDVDSVNKPAARKRVTNKRIEKRGKKKSSIVFPKFIKKRSGKK